MNPAADLVALYAAHGESITVGGTGVRAFFDGGYSESLDVAGVEATARCVTADVAAVQVGVTVVRGSRSYTVRNILPLSPDEMETLLVLQRT